MAKRNFHRLSPKAIKAYAARTESSLPNPFIKASAKKKRATRKHKLPSRRKP